MQRDFEAPPWSGEDIGRQEVRLALAPALRRLALLRALGIPCAPSRWRNRTARDDDSMLARVLCPTSNAYLKYALHLWRNLHCQSTRHHRAQAALTVAVPRQVFFSVGPVGSGLAFHQHGEAWNVVTSGAKWWCGGGIRKNMGHATISLICSSVASTAGGSMASAGRGPCCAVVRTAAAQMRPREMR